MTGCPCLSRTLASEAATLGSPLPCARLDVGAISVCIAARPPNLGREKDLLHFFCIGLFVFNFEISRANPRRGTHSRSAQRLNTPLAAVHTLRGILWEVPTSGKISKAEHESKADAPSAFIQAQPLELIAFKPPVRFQRG